MGRAIICAGDLPPPLVDDEQDDNCSPADKAVEEFFLRNGFDPSTRKLCDDFARSTYALASADPTPNQGYCSYTLKLPGEHLLQFRPRHFKLDLQICLEARKVFSSLVPMTAHIGTVRGSLEKGEGQVGNDILEVYLQTEMPGVTLAKFRKMKPAFTERERAVYRHRLVEDMAEFFATSFLHRRYPGRAGDEFPRGKIGSSLRERMDILEDLPDNQKQAKLYLQAIKERLDSIESEIPWCLTHGDLVAENILVDPNTGRLSGLIDWAEGEWLPYGVGLYGLEELLGETNSAGSFEFYHQDLRASFWRRLLRITQPRQAILSNRWLDDVRLCRGLGILLWRGIAFDEGKLDRVVDSERDASEVQKLEVFLGAPPPLEGAGWKWRVELLFLCVEGYLGCSSSFRGSGERVRPSVTGPVYEASSPSIKARESWRETT